MSRRGGCVGAVVLLLLLVVGALLVADRVGVRIAESKVAQGVADRGGLSGTPTVDITGFPFLTQALSGRYEDVRISLTADDLGQPPGTRADISLEGVHMPLSDLLSGSVQQIPVDRIDGTATLPYDLLAGRLGGNTTLAAEGDRLRITRTVEVMGFDVPVTALGTVTLDGQDLVVDVSDVAAAGVSVPGFLLDAAADRLDFRYPLPPLPFGLRLTSVRPRAYGVDVQVVATNTVLSG
jgi:hypothetical protein